MSKKPSGFQHSDVLIITETENGEDWSQILANEKGRTAINEIIAHPIDWEHGGSREVCASIGAPPDWRVIDVSLAQYERDGLAKRVPRAEGSTSALRTSIRWAIAAKLYRGDVRVVVYDGASGSFNLVEVDGEKAVTNIINFDRWKGRH